MLCNASEEERYIEKNQNPNSSNLASHTKNSDENLIM